MEAYPKGTRCMVMRTLPGLRPLWSVVTCGEWSGIFLPGQRTQVPGSQTGTGMMRAAPGDGPMRGLLCQEVGRSRHWFGSTIDVHPVAWMRPIDRPPERDSLEEEAGVVAAYARSAMVRALEGMRP